MEVVATIRDGLYGDIDQLEALWEHAIRHVVHPTSSFPSDLAEFLHYSSFNLSLSAFNDPHEASCVAVVLQCMAYLVLILGRLVHTQEGMS